jgi:hypothetical protein
VFSDYTSSTTADYDDECISSTSVNYDDNYPLGNSPTRKLRRAARYFKKSRCICINLYNSFEFEEFLEILERLRRFAEYEFCLWKESIKRHNIIHSILFSNNLFLPPHYYRRIMFSKSGWVFNRKN